MRRNKNKWFVETLVWLGIFLSFFLFNASRSGDWFAGKPCMGPRYLIPTVPFLVLPLMFVFKKVKLKTVLVLGLFSILINWIGAQYPDLDSLILGIGHFLVMPFTSPVSRFSLVSNACHLVINGLFIVEAVAAAFLILKEKSKKNPILKILFILMFITVFLNYYVSFKTRNKYYLIGIPEKQLILFTSSPAIDVQVFNAPLSSGIRLESFMTNSINVYQHSKVATLEVFSDDGDSHGFKILVGKDTAEWAWSKLNVRFSIKHQMAKIAESRIELETSLLPFPANVYYTEYKFRKPIKPTRIRILYNYPDNKIDYVVKKVFLTK